MLFLDMDGVLCDLVSQIECFLGTSRIYNESNYGTYFLQKACPYITFEQIKECFALQSFWSTMSKLEWADEIVSWAEKISPPEETYILTCPWNTSGCESTKGKLWWIVDNYPQFAGRIIFSSKKELFANPKSVLVDDNKTYCENFAKAGGKTVFIPTPWGDTEYASRNLRGKNLVKEVLECNLQIVESMLR